MQNKTLSRADLKYMSEKTKLDHINVIIDKYINSVESAAAIGETVYIIEHEVFHYQVDSLLRAKYGNIDSDEKGTQSFIIGEQPVPDTLKVTSADVTTVLRDHFPDCNVYYQESWENTNENTRVLRKRYIIDWS
jgi:hypothetical protein